MAPRAYWKGYLKLSLVSCPIALYPASSPSERISFHRVNKQTGNRLRQQMVDPESGEVVPREEIGRGYEIGKGQYVLIEDEELEKVQIESTHTIDIDTFVPKAEVDERYLENPYYLAPTDKVGQEPFAVIRDSIRDMKMVALGRVVLSRRERVIMLEPFERGLLGMTLRYPYEVRSEKAYFDDIAEVKLPAEMRELAAHIVKTKSGRFDPSKFEDHYETALIELLRRKQEGKRIEPIREAARPSNVVNLMDALRKSVQAEGGRGASSRSRASGERRRAAPRPRKSSGRARKAG
jgi:DNA end-binding protein Ku